MSKELIEQLVYHVPTEPIECNGYKCRDSHCLSCFDEDSVNKALERNRELIVKAKAYQAAAPKEPVYIIISGADEIKVSKDKYDAWTSEKRIEAAAPIDNVANEAMEELERALCVIGVVGKIDGYDVIRRESVIGIARRRIKAIANRKDGV
jgi:hypothetical protein